MFVSFTDWEFDGDVAGAIENAKGFLQEGHVFVHPLTNSNNSCT